MRKDTTFNLPLLFHGATNCPIGLTIRKVMNKSTLPIAPRTLAMKHATLYSGMSEPTLRQYEKAGMIRFIKIKLPGNKKGKTLVDRESLDRLVSGQLAEAEGGKA